MPEVSSPADLAVVVVSYGSHDLVRRNLGALSRAVPEARVVVVDNFTTRLEQDRVRELCAEHGWLSVLMDENVGFGSGVNAGVAALGPEARQLLLLNPDATIDRESVGRLQSHVDQHPLDLVAPAVLAPDGTPWSVGADLDLGRGEMRSWLRRAQEGTTNTQPWLSGACLLLSRDLWDRIGGFDDDYFLYWEDVDLSSRVLSAGGRLSVVEQATAVHDEGSTHRGDIPSRAKSGIYYRYNTRNRLLFAAKHLSRSDQRRWLRTAPVVGYRIVLQGGRRQLLHPQRSLWPAIRGTWDGARLLRRARRQPSGHSSGSAGGD